MSNTFGTHFRITTFGESHSPAVGCVIDGCPPGLLLSIDKINDFLSLRRATNDVFSTSRLENDEVEVLSGLDQGITLGSPLCFMVRNQNVKTTDYSKIQNVYRPSHADYTYEKKYGLHAASGGGRASARETVARVIAGAVAKQCLQTLYPDLEILVFVQQAGTTFWDHKDDLQCGPEDIYQNPWRCPDIKTQLQFQKIVRDAKENGDTLGGSLRGIVRNPPMGLGEPVFGKLEALLAQGMMSIPAVKYFESGTGFQSTTLLGSENNDAFYIDDKGQIRTKTNHSGGIQGGVSNGMPITFSVGFKPVSTLFQNQNTVDKNSAEVTFHATQGRHDVCVLPRAVPIVEAMTWVILMNAVLSQRCVALFHKKND